LNHLISLARKFNKTILYDIDDLVIDTKYTDQLDYTRSLNFYEKANYDAMVTNYGLLMSMCDGVVTTTIELKKQLKKYTEYVLLNRNLASSQLIEISNQVQHNYLKKSKEIKIGYFSGSITHNENFELIKTAIVAILEKFDNVKIYVIGYLDLPKELEKYRHRFVTNDYVDWKELPKLISEVDINLAPLKDTIFNRAKSEIKWIEASLVKVPTIASDIGSFNEMIINEKTGFLANDNDWFPILNRLIQDSTLRERVGNKAYEYVTNNCTTLMKEDELIRFLKEDINVSKENN